jgi:hypothetical protein
MSPVRSRVIAPVRLFPAARLAVLGLAVLAAGCASKSASTYPGERLAGPVPQQHQQQAWAPKVEIEDDGLPAQLAPRHRRPEPDDPREPWSPNYGVGKAGVDRPAPQPAEPTPAAAPQPIRRAALSPIPPVAARPAQPTRLSEVDEDAIIRRAIAELEMRRAD